MKADGKNQERSRAGEFEPFGWGSFAFGILLGVAVVYLIAVRPSQRQVASLEIQISRLDRNMDRLVDARGGAEEAHDLLSLLRAQGDLAAEARQVVADQALLQEGLIAQSDQVYAGLDAIGMLEHLQTRLRHQQGMTAESLAAMAAIDRLNSKVGTIRGRLPETEVSLDRIANLHDRLRDQYPSALEAEDVVNQFLNVQSQLLMAQRQSKAAGQGLGALVRLQEKLLQEADQARSADLVLDNVIAMQREMLEISHRSTMAKLATEPVQGTPVQQVSMTNQREEALAHLGKWKRGMQALMPRNLTEATALLDALARQYELAARASDAADSQHR
ncbi:MAG: hypothetical protein WEE51_03840 [Pirellulaceae bacterium]